MDRDHNGALRLLKEDPSYRMILLAAACAPLDFEEARVRLGIARNVLASRLNRLVEARVLCRHISPLEPRRINYQLTAQGRGLLPIHDAFEFPVSRASMATASGNNSAIKTICRLRPQPKFTRGTTVR
jgi:DNA-binding HxlR family transcriptional regulator